MKLKKFFGTITVASIVLTVSGCGPGPEKEQSQAREPAPPAVEEQATVLSDEQVAEFSWSVTPYLWASETKLDLTLGNGVCSAI